ncbi:MAG: hypothetical protein ACOYJY_08210, partial [Acutalibacteraceae bacterium]
MEKKSAATDAVSITKGEQKGKRVLFGAAAILFDVMALWRLYLLVRAALYLWSGLDPEHGFTPQAVFAHTVTSVFVAAAALCLLWCAVGVTAAAVKRRVAGGFVVAVLVGLAISIILWMVIPSQTLTVVAYSTWYYSIRPLTQAYFAVAPILDWLLYALAGYSLAKRLFDDDRSQKALGKALAIAGAGLIAVRT